MDSVLKEYRDNEEHEYKQYSEKLSEFKTSNLTEPENSYFPVYYSEVFGHIMLSPACITREIYHNKLKDLVGNFHTCSNRRNLCPACSLFGIIGEDFQVSSRLRFGDLNCEDTEDAKSCYHDIVTLKPLSSPKLNNMEFYLQKPDDAWFWTYDYYIDSKGDIKPYPMRINGRKFYWHQMNDDLPKHVKRTNLNMTIRPVRSKLKFSGKIYFQKLTQTELDQLLWVLNAGDEAPLEQKTHGYKLGAAKPLGLGSVALSVDEVYLRKIVKDSVNHTVRMEEVPVNEIYGDAQGFDKEVLNNFVKMTSFDIVKGKKCMLSNCRWEKQLGCWR